MDTIDRADTLAALEGVDELTRLRRDLYHIVGFVRAEIRLARDAQKKAERLAAQHADNPLLRLTHLQHAAVADAKAAVAGKILDAITARLEDGEA